VLQPSRPGKPNSLDKDDHLSVRGQMQCGQGSATHSIIVINDGLISRDVVSVSTSPSRDVSTSRLILVSGSRLDQNAQRLGLVSDLCVSDLVSVSTQNVSASRLGSRTISSCRDVSCRRAQLNYNSPMKTSRPMTYSVGRVLGTVCLLIFPLLIYHEHHKSLKTVIPDELSKRDLLSLL